MLIMLRWRNLDIIGYSKILKIGKGKGGSSNHAFLLSPRKIGPRGPSILF